MRKKISTALAVTAIGIFSANPAFPTTLTDALIQAYQLNPALKVARASLRNTDETVEAARAALRPTVALTQSLSKTRNLNNGTNVELSAVTSLTASQVIFDGGQTWEGIDAARMGVLAQRQALIATEQSVLLNAITAYLNVRRDHEAIRLAKNNVRVLRQQVQAAKDRFEVGEVTRTDVSLSEARLAAAISNQAAQEGSRLASIVTYQAIIGSRPTNLRNPPAPPALPKSVKSAETIAISRHPAILQASFSVKAAEHALKSAKRNKSPTVTAQITARNSHPGVTALNPQQDGTLKAGLNTNWNLYTGGSRNSAQRAALARLEQAQFELQQAAITRRQSVGIAYAQWQITNAQITANRQAVKSAQLAFEGLQEEANLGARTTLDVLDAEQELLDARNSLVSSIRDLQVRAYTVLSEVGLLTVDHLGLGIETYDPNVNYQRVNKKKQLDPSRRDIFDKILKRRGDK